MYDLIVVGGGPAGLTATIYAIRKRLNVLLVSKDLGGKTNFRLELPWVEDYQVYGVTGVMFSEGVTQWYDQGDTRNCYIFIKKPYGPKDYRQIYILGHELLHCTEGAYH